MQKTQRRAAHFDEEVLVAVGHARRGGSPRGNKWGAWGKVDSAYLRSVCLLNCYLLQDICIYECKKMWGNLSVRTRSNLKKSFFVDLWVYKYVYLSFSNEKCCTFSIFK